ncbi:hypothetical protein B0H13DRAFT_1868082 [Mycena leptocephala]|nr:hypothetical protein B0H13DRAFT_1868082 [Mycena leptocephala]
MDWFETALMSEENPGRSRKPEFDDNRHEMVGTRVCPLSILVVLNECCAIRNKPSKKMRRSRIDKDIAVLRNQTDFYHRGIHRPSFKSTVDWTAAESMGGNNCASPKSGTMVCLGTVHPAANSGQGLWEDIEKHSRRIVRTPIYLDVSTKLWNEMRAGISLGAFDGMGLNETVLKRGPYYGRFDALTAAVVSLVYFEVHERLGGWAETVHICPAVRFCPNPLRFPSASLFSE